MAGCAFPQHHQQRQKRSAERVRPLTHLIGQDSACKKIMNTSHQLPYSDQIRVNPTTSAHAAPHAMLILAWCRLRSNTSFSVRSCAGYCCPSPSSHPPVRSVSLRPITHSYMNLTPETCGGGRVGHCVGQQRVCPCGKQAQLQDLA